MVHIANLEIKEQYPPLQDIKFDFDPRANVFIGHNGTGKTTVLRCISEQMGSIISEWVQNSGELYPLFSEDWPNLGGAPSGIDIEAYPQIFIPATRTILPVDNSDISYSSRGTDWVDIEAILTDNLYIFESLNSYHAVKLMYETGKRIQAAQVAWYAFRCAAEISREVVDADVGLSTYRGLPTTGTVADKWLELDENQQQALILLANPDIVHPAMGFQNVEGVELFVGELSGGTQGIYTWILYAALKLAAFNSFEDGWENSTGILIIDEIENHLHPTWQRRVIPALLDHFPGLQIFATSHSPFVVAGLKAGQVHLLNRDEHGVVTATTNEEDIIGWTADEILRTMMGVDDPTDVTTAAAAIELRQLRSEGPRDTVEAEEQRQQRMTELQENVDRDLLAGGSWKAQRELFEQQFDQALEQYRQSKKLDKDND